MGSWGIGILQNDTTADIWVEFKDLYNKGLSPKEIRIKLEKEYHPHDDEEYYGEIWTGIAYGQWMCGDLEEYTLGMVKASTEFKWLTLWAEDQKLLQKRINALTEFITKIQMPKPVPLKPKKVVERRPLFKTGEIIALKIDTENSIVGIVVNHHDHPLYGENTIVLTDLAFTEKPTEKEIFQAGILYFDKGGEYNYHQGFFRAIFSARNMARKAKDTTKIGEVTLKDYLSLGVGIRVGDWNKVGLLYAEQVEFLKNNKSAKPFEVTVSDLLNPKEEMHQRLLDWDRKIYAEQLEIRKKLMQ